MLGSWVNRAGAKGIQVQQAASSQAARVVFTKEFSQPCTISTQQPVTQPGKHAFQVTMPRKDGRTAVGWQAEPPQTAYLTPSFTSQGSYVSMGGAGFVYPASVAGGGRYGQGDTIRVELDLGADGKGVVRFLVNGRPAGQAPWTHGLAAYPAISCENGVVECDIQWSSS